MGGRVAAGGAAVAGKVAKVGVDSGAELAQEASSAARQNDQRKVILFGKFFISLANGYRRKVARVSGLSVTQHPVPGHLCLGFHSIRLIIDLKVI